MASQPVASLTSKGWITDPEGKADRMLAYYFTSQYSQSNIYAGNITSLQYQIQQWGNDPSQLQNQMARAIEIYLSHNFDHASVNVKVIDPTSTTDNRRMSVQVDAVVTQDGVSYSLGRLVAFLNSVVVSIMNTLNGSTTAFNA